MNELKNGIVLGCVGGLYEIQLPDGDRLQCKACGRFRHEKLKVLPGDGVTVTVDELGGELITQIANRKNALIRPPMANLDRLFIVASVSVPKTMPLNLDKLISIAEHEGIEPILVISKEDLGSDEAEALASVYRNAGLRVFVTASASGSGVDELRHYLLESCEGISAFAGASGSGKSTLMNALFPGLSLDTGSLSRKIERGKNTTRAVTLYPLRELAGENAVNGFLADTPGFTMLDFVSFDFFSLEDLPYTFREFRPLLGGCRYTDCTHTKEEDCAIVMAVKDGRISPSRHESFRSLYLDLKDKRPWDK